MGLRTSSDDGKHRNKICARERCFFSSSRNAALIERKMLQYTTLSVKYHHCTLIEMTTEFFTMSDRNNFQSCTLSKYIEITLQTCVDVANENLQAYNTGADVKNHVFCSLHQCKCAGNTMFLFSLTKIFGKKINIFT